MSICNIVILGAGGFIGKNLALDLICRGQSPVLVSPKRSNLIPSNIKQIEARISEFSCLEGVIRPGSVVYYLIGDMTPYNSRTNPSRHIETNLTLFVRFLEWLRDIGGVHVVFVSSGGAIYGDSDIQPTHEGVQPNPKSFYAVLKLAAEQHLRLFASQADMTYTVARVSNPYGPDQEFKHGQGLVPKVIDHILNDVPIDVFGDGKSVRDYVHIRDLTSALFECGARPSAIDQTINIGTGVGKSIIDVIEAIARLLGREAKVNFIPSAVSEVRSIILDIRLANVLLGWVPVYSFDEGLKTLLN